MRHAGASYIDALTIVQVLIAKGHGLSQSGSYEPFGLFVCLMMTRTRGGLVSKVIWVALEVSVCMCMGE